MWKGKGSINGRQEEIDNRRKIGRNSQVWGCGGGKGKEWSKGENAKRKGKIAARIKMTRR